MTRDELLARVYKDFTYHPPTEEQAKKYTLVRSGALGIATMLVDICPQGRELSTALTKLEECVMHANAAIARHEQDTKTCSHSRTKPVGYSGKECLECGKRWND